MEQFSLEKYLENQSRKITTRYGDREVRIICTDRKGKCPIVALMVDMDDGSEYITSHSINGWIDDEEKYPDKRDLFFADEEEKLTEFEKTVQSICENLRDGIDNISDIHILSNNLLDLARKELMSEISDFEIYDKSFKEGKKYILKDFPKWKDVSGKNGAGTKDYEIVGYYLVKGNHAIYLKDLEKLPKEE